MGGGNDPGLDLAQPVEHRQRQGAALAGVGAGAEFVEQHQGVAVGAGQDIANPQPGARKRLTGSLDTLLVADVGHHRGEGK